MNIDMTRKEYEALPRRADLVNDPLPGQDYRDENGGIVRFTLADFGLTHRMRSPCWVGYCVTLRD